MHLGMVLLAERERMTSFIAERLEESTRYQILERDASHLLVRERHEWEEKPNAIYVFAHSVRTPVEDMRRRERYNQEHNIFSAHVFYRDGKTFFVPLGKRALAEKALGDCAPGRRSAMIHLRDLEKAVLTSLGLHPHITAVYQPASPATGECIQLYEMVTLVGQPDLDYRLPRELVTVTKAAYLHLDEGETLRASIRPYRAVLALPSPEREREPDVADRLTTAVGRR